eukprot:TRINITY_DN8348_c0_g1_i1.p1 TRINITY_DN8348_c0_g1~~TRINITY_DN8348_c0_g1_i1.p1  ORF type:complete len:256 (+),score=122.90 TRINITY_DN8348_c0_g1_i1:64-768(+)
MAPPAKKQKAAKAGEKAAKAGEKAAKAGEKAAQQQRARLADLNQQIAQLCEAEEEALADVKERAHATQEKDKARVLEEAVKGVPTLWGDAVAYSEVLAPIISDDDKAALKSLRKISVEVMESLEFKLSMHFDGNAMFTDAVLWRVFGGETEEASGVAWKTGRSPTARNQEGGLQDDDPDSHFSLFELFEDGNLGEDELSVLFELRTIAEDPIPAYLGREADDEDSSVEALELGE